MRSRRFRTDRAADGPERTVVYLITAREPRLVAEPATGPRWPARPGVVVTVVDQGHGIPREQVIRDVLLAQQPSKRFATVEELGALAVFLASDAAASITGAALPVDGGWTAH